MSRRDRVWIGVLTTLVLAQVASSLFVRRGEELMIASDLIQTALLFMAAVAFLPNASRSRSSGTRVRLFWILVSAGLLFRLIYQVIWNYFEVVRRVDVPNPFSGDLVLFLHLVPIMAALALAPHQQQDERDARLGMLDFAFLLTWWVYLYVYIVLPWQYVEVNEPNYSRTFNDLYLTEKLVLLLGLGVLVYLSEGGWRHLYAQLLAANALYASSSYLANWAIERQIYYSGSIYDIPLSVSIAWVAILGRFAYRYQLTEVRRHSHSPLGIWVTRCGMLAVFSLPAFALHSQLYSDAPVSVKNFRTILTLATLLIMGVMVFWRQALLGSELVSLLSSSNRSYEDLKTLQAQLIQSEKLASLGRLVGGAAHEINNPLTAMLGYSDLMNASPLPHPEHGVALRIAEQVRRTKTMVASLLTFARQAPANLAPTDLNSVLQTALRLIRPQIESRGVALKVDLGAGLPTVLADSNQLLHVCLHLAGQTSANSSAEPNALHIRTFLQESTIVMEMTGENSPADGEWRRHDSDSDSELATLSLSACRRIVREHGGRTCSRLAADGNVEFRLEFPIVAKVAQAVGAGAAATL